VEPLSLDEAYLDVTVNHVGETSATRIARAIKADIRRETGLTASAGVAPNKFLAKIASDEKKPDGLFVIRPQDVAAFVASLPIAKLPGVGQATLRVFEALGLHTCGELAAVPLAELTHRFGKRGAWFHALALGVDERAVEPHRERKSVSIEDTFAEDHDEPGWLLERLHELCDGLGRRLAGSGVKGRTVTLKLRTSDFQIHTRSRTLPRFTADPREIEREAATLFQASGLVGRKLRLLGVGVHQLDTAVAESTGDPQLVLPWAEEA
jgi:DNA polymerase-4